MRNKILAVGILVILIVVDYFATKNLGAPAVALHRAEFMADWFRGTVADWTGLIALNVIWLFIGVASTFDITLSYEDRGSYAKSILFALVGSIISLILIYA